MSADVGAGSGVNHPAPRPRISAVKVSARGEEFRIVQVQGNLFVCSRSNGNRCCGWEEKGRFVFDNSLWADEWERRTIRNRLHLTFHRLPRALRGRQQRDARR